MLPFPNISIHNLSSLYINPMKRVAIYKKDLLPISETFIRDQAKAIRDWEPILVGLSEIEGGLQTPGVRREIITVSNSRYITRLRLWIPIPITRVVNHLQLLNVDLVHTHFATVATDIWPSVMSANLPMLVTLHGYDINVHREWWEKGYGGQLMKAYPSRLLNMASHPNVHFVAVSEAIRSRAIQYGIPATKIHVSYIGIDLTRFRPGQTPIRNRPRRILFTGRMVEKKAPLLMVKAYSEVRKTLPDAELVMIGSGPLLEQAKRLARELNAPVSFLGSLSSDSVVEQINQARVFCLPSVTANNGDAEGFGMVLLEAQACGVPVVTSALGGATEGLLERETGFAFPENNLGALVTHLLTILSNETLNTQMSHSAIEFALRKFDILQCTRSLENIYAQCMYR